MYGLIKSLSVASNAMTNLLKRNAPAILTGVGVGGMAASIILSIKMTPKAIKAIDDEQDKRYSEVHEKFNESSDEEYFNAMDEAIMTKWEKFKVAYKYYIPTALSFVASAACVIGAQSINSRRIAVLSTAYSLLETDFNDYKNKVKETIGDKKERKIRKEIVRDKAEKEAKEIGNVDLDAMGVVQGTGTVLFEDDFGRYFWSDIRTVEKLENELNRRLISEMFISINEFYYELGIRGHEFGDDIGWCAGDLIEFLKEPGQTEKNQLFMHISYNIKPSKKYREYRYY